MYTYFTHMYIYIYICLYLYLMTDEKLLYTS